MLLFFLSVLTFQWRRCLRWKDSIVRINRREIAELYEYTRIFQAFLAIANIQRGAASVYIRESGSRLRYMYIYNAKRGWKT